MSEIMLESKYKQSPVAFQLQSAVASMHGSRCQINYRKFN